MNSPQLDNYRYEKQLWKEGFKAIMGLDEVGRGCLAGPVFAAGVVLKPESMIDGITDSKKLNERQRDNLEKEIKKNSLCWNVQFATAEEIDEINILNASILAMNRCVIRSEVLPDFLLVDGNRFSTETLIGYQCLVKGDLKSASIGAASILAKQARDRYMRKLHEECPEYHWAKNVGYPTEEHRAALRKYGSSVHHRKTFKWK